MLFELSIVYVILLSMHALQIFQDLLHLFDGHCQPFRIAMASHNIFELLWCVYARKKLLQEVTIEETERSNICITATASVMWRSESANESVRLELK